VFPDGYYYYYYYYYSPPPFMPLSLLGFSSHPSLGFKASSLFFWAVESEITEGGRFFLGMGSGSGSVSDGLFLHIHGSGIGSVVDLFFDDDARNLFSGYISLLYLCC
jgi:hypothetical protein